MPQPPTMLPAPPLQKTGGAVVRCAMVDSGSTLRLCFIDVQLKPKQREMVIKNNAKDCIPSSL